MRKYNNRFLEMRTSIISSGILFFFCSRCMFVIVFDDENIVVDVERGRVPPEDELGRDNE